MYLQKAHNGNYYFRWRIPNKERTLYNNRSEIVKSLKTKNAKLARKKANYIKIGLPILKERLLTMTNEDIDTIVLNWLNERLEADLNGRIEKSSFEGPESLPNNKIADYTEMNLCKYKQGLADLRTIQVKELGDALLDEQTGLTEQNHKRLLFQLLRANVQLFKTLTERNNGEIDFTIYSESKAEKRITYEEALKQYMPILLKKSKNRVKNETEGYPKQYQEAERFFMKKFLPVVGEKTLIHTNSSDCNDLLENAFKRDDDTVARSIIEWLKAFYVWLYDNRFIPIKISQDLVFETVPKKKRKAFTPEMVQKILTESTGEFNLFFKLYLYTGMRRDELFNCTYDDTNIGFNITKGKNSNALRFIPKHSSLEDISGDVFLGLQARWKPDYIGRQLNKWIKDNITIEVGYSLHSTRHCFNTWMVNAKINPNIIKRILGHEADKSDDMTTYYTTYFEIPNDKKNAVNSVKYLSTD